MNTQQLICMIQDSIEEHVEYRCFRPSNIYLDSINYHKLDYYVCERNANQTPYKPPPKDLYWEGLRVFKVDVQEDHVNVC